MRNVGAQATLTTAAPWSIEIRRGISHLHAELGVFDTQQPGAVGGATRLATPGWDTSTDRWAIEVTGGASQLVVTEQ
jgi:hypothetical protein